MVDLFLNGDSHYYDYFTDRYFDRKLFVPISRRMKSDLRFINAGFDKKNLCKTIKARGNATMKDLRDLENARLQAEFQDITEAMGLLLQNLNVVRHTTSLLDSEVHIRGEVKKTVRFGEERTLVHANSIRVNLILCNILPDFKIGNLSTEIRRTKSVKVGKTYAGKELTEFAETDVLRDLVVWLTQKTIREDQKLDRLRQAYADFIAVACSKDHKPRPEFYREYLKDHVTITLERLRKFVNFEN